MSSTQQLLLGEGAGGAAPVYIEDVYSTYVYTGNSTTGGTQTITNNIALSSQGGLTWIKGRNAASNHIFTDTSRGAGTTASNNQALASNLTTAEDLGASCDFLSSFNVDGFTVKQGGTTTATRGTNYNAVNYVSWSFRKQPKFFDVVTYTGDGTAGRQITHALGSAPGFLIVKKTSSTSDWLCYHTARPAKVFYLNALLAEQSDSSGTIFGNGTTAIAPTSTNFTVNANTPFPLSNINQSGETYVAYLYAHNAGGFGLLGTDNVISCGSYVGTGANLFITVGFEPQWLLVKKAVGDNNNEWEINDNIRGLSQNGSNSSEANTALAEGGSPACATATGFGILSGSSRYNSTGHTYIYIAIRRGPMKVPTSGAGVFQPVARTGTGATATVTNSSISYVDFLFSKMRDDTAAAAEIDRLRGNGYFLYPAYTDAEANPTGFPKLDVMNGYTTDSVQNFNQNAKTFINYLFKRAPSFLDVVCYTGTGTITTFNHNLGVAPELMIVKSRSVSSTTGWVVYSQPTGNTKYTLLNYIDAAAVLSGYWNNTSPTASVFTLGAGYFADTNKSGDTYVAYLFATCPGVSKVGSYTGTGALQTVNCGFTSGARFVMIKRTDTTGAWYYYDSARGISSGDDPYLIMNTDAVEVTNTNYVDTDSTGFKVTAAAPAGLNASGGTYIFLAIA